MQYPKSRTVTVNIYLLILGTVLSLLLFTHCGGTSVIIKNDLDQAKMAGKSLALILEGNFFIDYEGDLDSRIGTGDHDSVISSYVTEHLLFDVKRQNALTQTIVTGVQQEYTKIPETIQYKETILFVPVKRKMKLFKPQQGVQINCRDFDADYVLFVHKPEVKTITRTGPPYTSTGGDENASGVRRNLYLKFGFVLWDNRERQGIRYGVVNIDADNFSYKISKKTWDSMLEKAVRKMFQEVPMSPAS